MNCFQAKKMMSDYIDNNLDKEKKQSFEKHLSECQKCSQKTADIKTLEAKLRALRTIKPSEDFLGNFYNRLRHDSIPEKKNKYFLPLTTGIAAAIVIAVMYSNYFYSFSPDILTREEDLTELADVKEDNNNIFENEENDRRIIEKSSDIVLEAKQKSSDVKSAEIVSEISAEIVAEIKESTETDSHTSKELEYALLLNYKPVSPNFVSISSDKDITFSKVMKGAGNVEYRYEKDKAQGTTEFYTPLEYMVEILLEIQNLVVSINGTISSLNYGAPPYLIAEIPCDNFDVFKDKICKLGDIQTFIAPGVSELELSSVDKNNDNRIQIQITVNMVD